MTSRASPLCPPAGRSRRTDRPHRHQRRGGGRGLPPHRAGAGPRPRHRPHPPDRRRRLHRPRGARRGQPGLVARGHDLGDAGRGRRPGGRRGPTGRRRPGRGGGPAVQRGPGAGHRGRRPVRRVRRVRAGVRWRGARHDRGSPGSSPSTRTRWSSTWLRAPSATTSSTNCGIADSPWGTGPSRSRSPPSAAGSPAGARVSSATATARSRTWSSASTWCSPTGSTSAPGAHRGPLSAPTSPSSSWVRRARSASSPVPVCASTRRRATSGGPPSPSPVPRPRRSAPPTTCAGGSCNGERPRPSCGSTTPRKPTAATRRVIGPSCWSWTRVTRWWSTPPWRSSRRCAVIPTAAPNRSTSRSSAAGWRTATRWRRSKP